MITWLKQWILNRRFVQRELDWQSYARSEDLTPEEPNEEQASKELCREILKVKDFSQIRRQLSPDARKEYAAAGSLVYNSQPFLDIIREIQQEQMEFTVLQSENDRQLMIARGTINGADLIESRMAALDVEHQANVKDAQPVDGSQEFEPINKLETN